jgi:Adenylate and Guanylate cyclase catalytic domain
VALINEMMSRFDALSVKHGAEKIKTIGDAYMCPGCPNRSPITQIGWRADGARDVCRRGGGRRAVRREDEV